MLSKEEINRYERQIRVNGFGLEGQLKLKQGRVLVIGAGGLGCAALQYLTAAGVGHIMVVDGDTISASNLQRQPLYTSDELTLPKAQTIAVKLTRQNPFVTIQYINTFLNTELALQLIPEYDIIVDCSDNFGTRYLINDVCVAFQKPFVSAALFQTEGQLGVFNLLLENNYTASYRDVFPESDKSMKALDCNESGVIATLPGILGVMQANEVIKYFVSPSFCLSNELIIFNALNMQQFRMKLNAGAGNILSLDSIRSYNYEVPCSITAALELNESQLQQVLNGDFSIIDVRELLEEPLIQHAQIKQIPLNNIMTNHHALNQYEQILFVCRSGQRSRQAAEHLRRVFPEKRIYSYNFGIEHLMNLLNHEG